MGQHLICSKLLFFAGYFLPLLFCKITSYCTHPLHFRPVSSSCRNVLFGYVFTFSEKRVTLRDVFRLIPLRFLMQIMIPKEHTYGISTHFLLMLPYAVSLSNLIRCLPESMCFCRLRKTGMTLCVPLQGRSTLIDLITWDSSSIDCGVLD